MKPIEISTERLLLKPLGSEYVQTVNSYAMDLENTKYMCRLPNKNLEETADFLKNIDVEWKKEQPEFYEFAILYESGHIGAVSIYFENGMGELGWILNKKYWGKGFAYEAATENIASYRVMEKLGMVRTGQWGGRRNRSASRDSFEYRYELVV